MFGSRVKIDRTLLEKATRYAADAGYASVEEFVEHAIEKEMARLAGGDSEEAIPEATEGPGLHLLVDG